MKNTENEKNGEPKVEVIEEEKEEEDGAIVTADVQVKVNLKNEKPLEIFGP
jgi:hypothetical protein